MLRSWGPASLGRFSRFTAAPPLRRFLQSSSGGPSDYWRNVYGQHRRLRRLINRSSDPQKSLDAWKELYRCAASSLGLPDVDNTSLVHEYAQNTQSTWREAVLGAVMGVSNTNAFDDQQRSRYLEGTQQLLLDFERSDVITAGTYNDNELLHLILFLLELRQILAAGAVRSQEESESALRYHLELQLFHPRSVLPSSPTSPSSPPTTAIQSSQPRQLTAEQQAVVNSSTAPGLTVVQARAGTGKTTVCAEYAKKNPILSVLYVCYNKSLSAQAEKLFAGTSAQTRTLDSLVHEHLRNRHGDSFLAKVAKGDRLLDFHQKDVVKLLGIKDHAPELGKGSKVIAPRIAQRVIRTLEDGFCVDPHARSVELRHVVPQPEHSIDREQLRCWAEQLWQLSIDMDRKDVPCPLSVAKKMACLDAFFQLKGPDVMMLDEIQDLNPVDIDLIYRHCDATRVVKPSRVILIGDEHQAIYGFRGAHNDWLKYLSMPSTLSFTLSETFRFGPRIATAANSILHSKDCDTRLIVAKGSGTDLLHAPLKISSLGQRLKHQWAHLCLYNLQVIEAMLDIPSKYPHLRIYLALNDLLRKLDIIEFLTQAHHLCLQAGFAPTHPRLKPFATWQALENHLLRYRGDLPSRDLCLRHVWLLEHRLRQPNLLQNLQQAKSQLVASSEEADVVVGTVHQVRQVQKAYMACSKES